MRNRKMRVIAFILAAALVFSAVPFSSVNAQATEVSDVQEEYEKDSLSDETASEDAAAIETSSGDSADSGTDADSEDEDDDNFTITYINPLYEDVIDEEDLNSLETADSAEEDAFASKARTLLAATSYSDVTSAGEYMRGEMEARTGTISFTYIYESAASTKGELESEVSTLFYNIFYEAIEHTGVPTEGDYLKWQWAGWRGSYGYRESEGTYTLTMTYVVTYYTTAAQEEEVDEAVEVLLEDLNIDPDTTGSICDYHVIAAVYDYICENVTYDYDNLYDDSYYLKYTAYAALIDHTAVCQGYALLFYRLMLECGIDARLVPNTSHGWNIVQITEGNSAWC